MGLITTVRQELGEASAVFWTDQQIVDALNEAQVCVVADYPRVLETSTSVALTTASSTFSVPASIMVPKSLEDSDGNEITFCSRTDLENYSSTWRTTSVGKPQRFVLWQYDTIQPWPVPDQTYTYTLRGIAWPTELTTSADTSSLHPDIQFALVAYATYCLFTPTRPDLAGVYYNMYTETMAQQNIRARKQLSHNTRRLRPGGTLTSKQRGAISRSTRVY